MARSMVWQTFGRDRSAIGGHTLADLFKLNPETMIQFFRRIRQQLLTENKFSKYLMYAIGEIALVMIGILLALQVGQ
ncbi:MAG: hypothetical protein WBN39_13620 [Flavobacteriaceae bacterium]